MTESNPPLIEAEMTNKPSFSLDKQPKTTSARTTPLAKLVAEKHAQRSLHRVWFAGIALNCLLVIYGIALWNNNDKCHDVLVIVGSTIGYMLGSRDRDLSE